MDRFGAEGRARTAERPGRTRASASRARGGEKLIAGIPARIMRPRIMFACCLVALVIFGLVMVYSASSFVALKEEGDAAYYLERQAIFAVIGALIVAVMSSKWLSWTWILDNLIWPIWGLMMLALVAVKVMGLGAGGAVRWIPIGPFTLQPSEIMKPVIIVLAAGIMSDYYERQSYDTSEFLMRLAIAVVAPLVLIFLQPDLGSTLIIALTVFAMAFFCGISYRLVFGVVAAAALLIIVAIAVAPYRMERLLAASDPWADQWDTGYQATLAIMAFASGGLFGRGIGSSTMKYDYLPEAHNDYIFAIIGEELGFVGTILFIAVFVALVWSAFAVAKQARCLRDRLIAEGCAVIIMVQFLVNALGILNVIPMTGKTMPFISYGGSSLIASLMLAGLVIRVSIESSAATVYRERRASFAVMGDTDEDVSGHIGRSTAGEVHVRRGGSATSRSGFSVVDGAAASSRTAPRGRPARPQARAGSGSYDRVDLGGDARDRLRGRDGSSRTARRGTSRRDRYDR
ncbi:putative lipid II flippase FtsW [Collinsella tanakaei]|uniref:putative lipid II flippase FtsW n=1 Tax=Collinsella tanakaei TaxID=626935 RepID=UPI001958144A|nr:putative lipid II flippase FtsW [Collinsella tanakaei]MBM6868720.1 putative lipid II flippase FtsW [Collinsella tanakaei]